MQKRFVYFFFGLLLLFGFYGVFFAQKIPINNGKGWDGTNYVTYIQKWPDPIVNKELPAYNLKRILLPAILYYICIPQAMMQGIGVCDLPTSTILRYFDFFNMASLLLAFFLLYKILVKTFEEKFTQQPWWIISWAVMNVYVTKMTFYYPALLDTFAFMLGTLILYGYITRNRYWVLIGMVLGYFTHPLLFLIGTLLMLWPDKIEERFKLPKIWELIILYLLGALFCYWLDRSNVVLDWARPLDQQVVGLSFLCAIAFLLYVLYSSELLSIGWNFIFKINWKNLILVALLYVGLSAFVVYARHESEGWTLNEFLFTVGYDSLQDPFIFIVAHVVYFGPGILLLFLFAHQWKVWLKQQTGGLQLVVWLMFIFMVNSESRQLVVFWPFAVLLVTVVISEWKQNYIRYASVAVLFISSRIWLDMHSDTFKNEAYYDFPAQYYFMHHGPWMSVENYYWQAAVTLLMGVLIFLYKRVWNKNKEITLVSE